MKQFVRYISVSLAFLAIIGTTWAQEFNPDDPPEPLTQKMVRVIAEPAEGVSSITTGGYHTVGESIQIRVTTNSSYDFEYWALNGRRYAESATFYYTVGDSAVTFTAILKKKPIISVSVSPANAGTVSGGGVFSPGTIRTISTTPKSGYTFQYWMLNGEQYSEERSFQYTVRDTDDKFVAVYIVTPEEPFNPDDPAEPMASYHVAVQTNLPEGVQPVSISQSAYYAIGANVYISIVPPAEYVFDYWTLNGQHYSDNASFNYTVGANNALFVAHCTAKKHVTVSCQPQGTATLSGGGYYSSGTKILLSATAKDGYKFVCWKLNDMRYSETPAFYYYVGSMDVDFVAVFEEDDSFNPDSPSEDEPFIPSNPGEPNVESTALLITVLVNDANLGSVSGLPTTPLVAGDQITLTATPAGEGYYFDRWENNSTANPRTITLTNDAIYTAYFAKRQYLITFYDEDGNTILDQRLWNYGDMPSCISPAKADDDHYSYRFDQWQPTLETVSDEASYFATYEPMALSPTTPTGNENIDADIIVQKVLRDGQLYILRGGKVYSVSGKEVK